MSSSHASLEAQANERKARLAKLKSLKRKQDDGEEAREKDENGTARYLSGRNYDAENRMAKSGFESLPTDGQETLEERAAMIALETSAQQKEEETEDGPIDLFKLQPKRPNWDLKRDLEKRMAILNTRTENAIARLVRQRIQEQQAKQQLENKEGRSTGDAEAVGMEGSSLVEGVHLREQEEEKEREGTDNEEI